jgi:hypothetical protein
MHLEEIRRHLRQQPFLSVRIFVSGGSAYLDPIHITRIEPIINGEKAQPNSRR